MIYIGYTEQEKAKIIASYIQQNNIQKTFTISPNKFPLVTDFETDDIEYIYLINYTIFYRLLQEINNTTLIVLSECLRTQDRNCLHYNCIRHFLNQTSHQLIFNQLPQIDIQEDFMTLFDFDTRSRWKRQHFDLSLIKQNSTISIATSALKFNKIDVQTTQKTKNVYAKRRKSMFANLGARDPHILPRRLYLIPGNDKQLYVNMQTAPMFTILEPRYYIARNQRFKHNYIHSYNNFDKTQNYSILEFQHRFIDFSDFIRSTHQFEFDVLTTELKVDQWYFNRYSEWGDRVNATCASLR